jgi:hypothetical protein
VIVLPGIKDHVDLMMKTSVTGANIFGAISHFRVIGQQCQSMGQIVVAGLGSQQAKIQNGLIQELFDIVDRGI